MARRGWSGWTPASEPELVPDLVIVGPLGGEVAFRFDHSTDVDRSVMMFRIPPDFFYTEPLKRFLK